MFKKIIYTTILILFLLISYKYFEQLNYIEKVNKDAKILQENYYLFSYKYSDAQPKNKKDVNKIFQWSKLKSLNKLYSLQLGYNIVYDTLNKKSFIYSFGKNKKDEKLHQTFFNSKKMDSIGQYSIKTINLFKYVFNSYKNDDIILAVLDDFEFKCTDYNKKHRLSYFELFKGGESLIGIPVLKDKFLIQLKEFKKEFHDENRSINNKSNVVTLFFIYKNGEIKIFCDNDITKIKSENLKNKLEIFFNKNDTEYFDYAFFSLKLSL